jgi:hypothetical protein
VSDDPVKDALGPALDALELGDTSLAVTLLINAVAKLATETRQPKLGLW